VSAILIIVGFQTMLNGLLADLIASNRKMLEEIMKRMREMNFYETAKKDIFPSHEE
jgi:hypothetical protein